MWILLPCCWYVPARKFGIYIPFSYPYKACAEHRLDSVPVTFKEGATVTVILAAQGYPGKYDKGKKITFGDLPSGV